MTFEAHWAPCVCQPKDMQDLATLHATQFAVDLLYILLSLVTGCTIMLESNWGWEGNTDEQVRWFALKRPSKSRHCDATTTFAKWVLLSRMAHPQSIRGWRWFCVKHLFMGSTSKSHRKMAPCTPNTSLSKKLQTPFSTAVMLKKVTEGGAFHLLSGHKRQIRVGVLQDSMGLDRWSYSCEYEWLKVGVLESINGGYH